MEKTCTRSLLIADPSDANPVQLALGDLFHQAATLHPDREAVVYACHKEVENVRWTYQQLDQMSTQLACALLVEGYKAGDKIAIWAPNSPEWILLEYALAKAGLVIVALNPLYKKAELEYTLQASAVKGIFHAETISGNPLRPIVDEVKHKVPSLQGIYSLHQGIEKLIAKNVSTDVLPVVDPDSCLMIQYTSGTTGQPKAAQLSHRGVATTARNSYLTWGFGAGDRICHGFPLFHVGGSGNSTPGAALVGATTLPLYIFKAGRCLDILEQEQCTGFIGVPYMLTAMMEHENFKQRDFSALKYIVIGGACVPSSLIHQCEQAFGVEIINGYGQTETSGVMTSTVASDSSDIKSTTSGKPLPGVSLKVIAKNGDILPCNTVGELCYQGPGKMLGYRNHPDPASIFDSEGWLYSGDLATINENGDIQIVGRAKEMIIRGGENLSPSEIESYFCQHPDIAEAAVIGLPDQKYGEEACAVLLPISDDHISEDNIRQWCLENLSRWKVPRYIVFHKSLPKTASGKVQKFLLRETMIKHFNLPAQSPK
ncbi:class I adenylate-forming enzyme family protein [Dasania marina]|uniref:class I adenylate-forming enzyme family protein n=1 Tax=Dasania marina TaxID=471499 RepID=UPI00037523AF|nr:AMP-binding protein [Dasania marina]